MLSKKFEIYEYEFSQLFQTPQSVPLRTILAFVALKWRRFTVAWHKFHV